MNYLNTKQVLDLVFNRVRDNSPALRVKMLGWLNSLIQSVVNERAWTFLEKTVTLPITSGSITLPADFAGETFVKTGLFIFTTADRLTDADAERWDIYGGDPQGYTIANGLLTFHGTVSGTATLTYTAGFPAAGYADGVVDMVLPIEFMPLLERGLLTAFYEYDVDTDRLPVSLQIDQEALRKIKRLDNSRRPLPSLHPKGYVR